MRASKETAERRPTKRFAARPFVLASRVRCEAALRVNLVVRTPMPKYTILTRIRVAPVILVLTLLSISCSAHRHAVPAPPPFPFPKATAYSDPTFRARRVGQLEKCAESAGFDGHDCYIELGQWGTIHSVPFLIRGLKQMEGRMMAAVDLKTGMQKVVSGNCTYFHCLQALRSITKADAGTMAQDWETWWEAYERPRAETRVEDGLK